MHKYGLALNTVINEGGWQVVKAGGTAGNTTINQNGELRVHAGGEASDVTQNTGGALVTSTAATVTGTNRPEHSLLWRVKLIMSYWKMADVWMC